MKRWLLASAAFAVWLLVGSQAEAKCYLDTNGGSICETAPAQSVGTVYSANAPSLASLGTLLITIPAVTTVVRRGYSIEADCAAGVNVVYDDGTDDTCTAVPAKCLIKPLAGGAADGKQGASTDMSARPHSGRIRVYSSNASCQIAAGAY